VAITPSSSKAARAMADAALSRRYSKAQSAPRSVLIPYSRWPWATVRPPTDEAPARAATPRLMPSGSAPLLLDAFAKLLESALYTSDLAFAYCCKVHPARTQVVLALIFQENEADASPVTGTASVVDGDTFDVGPTRIRLWDVDAMEKDQTCSIAGQVWDCAGEAAIKLGAFPANANVICRPQYTDPFHRTVAKCSVKGVDLGGWLVSQGLALDYVRYSQGAYAAEQETAKASGLGIWKGQFTPPWDWRHPEVTTGSVPQP